MREVVVGVIVREGRFLLTQRVPEKSYPFRWENPGGKVELEETTTQAIQRELFEELGTRSWCEQFWIQELKLLNNGAYFAPTRVIYFQVSLLRLPSPLVAIGMGWFTFAETLAMSHAGNLTPASDALIARMVDDHDLQSRLGVG